jgi:hypothetical protein
VIVAPVRLRSALPVIFLYFLSIVVLNFLGILFTVVQPLVPYSFNFLISPVEYFLVSESSSSTSLL